MHCRAAAPTNTHQQREKRNSCSATPAHVVCLHYRQQWMNETETHTDTRLTCHLSLSTFVLLTPFIQAWSTERPPKQAQTRHVHTNTTDTHILDQLLQRGGAYLGFFRKFKVQKKQANDSNERKKWGLEVSKRKIWQQKWNIQIQFLISKHAQNAEPHCPGVLGLSGCLLCSLLWSSALSAKQH